MGILDGKMKKQRNKTTTTENNENSAAFLLCFSGPAQGILMHQRLVCDCSCITVLSPVRTGQIHYLKQRWIKTGHCPHTYSLRRLGLNHCCGLSWHERTNPFCLCGSEDSRTLLSSRLVCLSAQRRINTSTGGPFGSLLYVYIQQLTPISPYLRHIPESL